MKRAIGIASLGWARSSRCIASMFLSKIRLRVFARIMQLHDQTADVDCVAIIIIQAVEGLLANRNKDLDVRIDTEQLADRAADAELTDDPDAGILVAVEIARIRLV